MVKGKLSQRMNADVGGIETSLILLLDLKETKDWECLQIVGRLPANQREGSLQTYHGKALMRMYLAQYIDEFQYPSLTDEFLRTWKRRVSASCCATRKLGRPLGLLKSFTFLFHISRS